MTILWLPQIVGQTSVPYPHTDVLRLNYKGLCIHWDRESPPCPPRLPVLSPALLSVGKAHVGGLLWTHFSVSSHLRNSTTRSPPRSWRRFSSTTHRSRCQTSPKAAFTTTLVAQRSWWLGRWTRRTCSTWKASSQRQQWVRLSLGYLLLGFGLVYSLVHTVSFCKTEFCFETMESSFVPCGGAGGDSLR